MIKWAYFWCFVQPLSNHRIPRGRTLSPQFGSRGTCRSCFGRRGLSSSALSLLVEVSPSLLLFGLAQPLLRPASPKAAAPLCPTNARLYAQPGTQATWRCRSWVRLIFFLQPGLSFSEAVLLQKWLSGISLELFLRQSLESMPLLLWCGSPLTFSARNVKRRLPSVSLKFLNGQLTG